MQIQKNRMEQFFMKASKGFYIDVDARTTQDTYKDMLNNKFTST